MKQHEIPIIFTGFDYNCAVLYNPLIAGNLEFLFCLDLLIKPDLNKLHPDCIFPLLSHYVQTAYRRIILPNKDPNTVFNIVFDMMENTGIRYSQIVDGEHCTFVTPASRMMEQQGHWDSYKSLQRYYNYLSRNRSLPAPLAINHSKKQSTLQIYAI